MDKPNNNILDDIEKDFINLFQNTENDTNKKSGLNPANHNTATKKYAKLSLSLTNKEKEQIEAYRDREYPGRKKISISKMIMLILEKNHVFDEVESD